MLHNWLFFFGMLQNGLPILKIKELDIKNRYLTSGRCTRVQLISMYTFRVFISFTIFQPFFTDTFYLFLTSCHHDYWINLCVIGYTRKQYKHIAVFCKSLLIIFWIFQMKFWLRQRRYFTTIAKYCKKYWNILK